MYQDKSILAIIPARGGSKAIPRKNLCDFQGKPLIAWSILAAKQSEYIDRCIISSDDTEIVSVAESYGCEAPFIRPKELASDTTPGIQPVLHAIQKCPGYDYVVILQPTSPFRTVADLDACIEYSMQKQADACVSVTEVRQHPEWMFKLDQDSKLQALNSGTISYRRQDLPTLYHLNGAIYFAKTDWLVKNESFLGDSTIAFEMPEERSIDIDTQLDLNIAKNIHP